MTLKPVAGPQARDQRAEDARVPDVDPDVIEPSFGPQRVRQSLQRLLDRRSVEFVKPGLLPRCGEQCLPIQKLVVHLHLPASASADSVKRRDPCYYHHIRRRILRATIKLTTRRRPMPSSAVMKDAMQAYVDEFNSGSAEAAYFAPDDMLRA